MGNHKLQIFNFYYYSIWVFKSYWTAILPERANHSVTTDWGIESGTVVKVHKEAGPLYYRTEMTLTGNKKKFFYFFSERRFVERTQHKSILDLEASILWQRSSFEWRTYIQRRERFSIFIIFLEHGIDQFPEKYKHGLLEIYGTSSRVRRRTIIWEGRYERK